MVRSSLNRRLPRNTQGASVFRKSGWKASPRFGTWPYYSGECQEAVTSLLLQGGSLSAYRANPQVGVEPRKDSYAWKLEREVERRFRVKHAVAVNSGTAALHAGLASLDLRGGEVITSPYTFSATASAIVLAGGTPVFADVDPYTFCITPETVKPYVTKRTKAILPVHLFGGLADVHGLRAFGVPVIEDACQAVGASRQGVYSGAFGLAGAYSFNGGKNVPAGECGVLVTNDPKVAQRARLLMNHAENFGADWVGLNYRPNELTACVAYHGLLELKERNQQRITLARHLYSRTPIGHPVHRWYGDHVFYVAPFTLRKLDRSLFIKRMKRMGVTVGGGYVTPPIHHYPAFRKYAKRELPIVDELSFKTLCLLDCVRPPATERDMEYVAECMKKALCAR